MDENAMIPPAASSGDKPGRTVRTFASDMEELKHEPAAKERLVAASPIPPPPPPAQPAPPPLPEMPSPTPISPELSPLKTYAGDFSDRMKETHASATTILAAEQDRAQRTVPQAVAEKPEGNGRLYIIAGAILLIAGAVGAYIAYSRYQTAREPVETAPMVTAPIFVDEREQITGAGPALLLSIQKSVVRQLSGSNVVRLLYVATSSDQSVFAALPLSAPDILVRNVEAEGSMAGVINVSGTQTPFFILAVSSYSNTFSGMLSWETVMVRALSMLYPAYPEVSAAQSTTTLAVAAKGQAGFRDETVGNHDVRVYRDEAGRSVVLYGYWNQSTLVIARDPAAFSEILGRLATARK